MKKAIALISAAVLIFMAAGCANKQPESEESTAEQTESILHTDEAVSTPGTSEEESSSTEEPTSPTAIVIVTGGKEYGIQQPDVTSVMEIVTTIAPLKPRPTVPPRPSTTKPTTTAKHTTTAKQTTAAETTVAEQTTAAVTTEKGTTAKPTTTVPFKAPDVVYSGEYTVTADGKTDSVKIVSHRCEEKENRTVSITLGVKTVEYSGTRSIITVNYDCYDAKGDKLNKVPLSFVVPLSGEKPTLELKIAAPKDTAKVVVSGCK